MTGTRVWSSMPLEGWIVSAQQEALTRDERLRSLNLTPIKRKAPKLDIAEAVVSLRVTLTIDGASYIQVSIDDPEWFIERSGLLDLNADGRLDPNIVITLDGFRFRVVKAARNDDTLTLTAEDEVKVLLDQHNKKLKATRGTKTRAEFIEGMVADVKAKVIPFVSPEIHKRQPVARPELPDTRPHGTTGFDDGTKFKIKGVAADAGQMREAATAMGVADQLDVTPRVRLAEIVAAIGESEYRAIANRAGSGYAGVHQADPDNIPANNTQKQVTYFFKGGLGFQAGGAIAYAAAHPHASAGEIAYKVEGSRANFSSDAEAEHHYQQWHDEAVKIAAAWRSGRGDADHRVLTYKAFELTRGLPGKKETTWTAADRLAREVNWRFFAVGGVVSFVSDDYLLSQPAALTLDALDDNGNFRTPPGLLRLPSDYDHDEGKTVSEVTLQAVAAHWAVLPGEVVVLRNMGPVSGRRIVQTFEFDYFDPTAATITLTKALPPRKEPAPQAVTVDLGDGTNSAGVNAAIAWAKSRLGHYEEEFGANIGRELDTLEARFGMRGAPWCAMFATTALIHGGVSRDCRTASVAEINEWAQAGTHGFTKGFRATPRPGDLMTLGDEHVAFVTAVDRDSVTTIEGNTGANQVATLTRSKNTGRFVRPDYPN